MNSELDDLPDEALALMRQDEAVEAGRYFGGLFSSYSLRFRKMRPTPRLNDDPISVSKLEPMY